MAIASGKIFSDDTSIRGWTRLPQQTKAILNPAVKSEKFAFSRKL
jgi:hypothetical protein